MKKQYSTALVAILSTVALVGSAAAGGASDKSGGGHDRMTHLDTDKNGKVTLAELTQSKQSWFTEVDTNKDGVVTTEELDAQLRAKHEKHAQELFQRKDTNKDGRLSREESGMPERWFARNDENEDGVLTPAELASRKAPQGKAGAPAGHRRGGRLEHMDHNGDGKIERSEAVKAAAVMLERMDQNKDGALTADELRGHGKRGRHGHPGEGHERKGSSKDSNKSG